MDLGLTARNIRDHANDIVQPLARDLDLKLHTFGRKAVGFGKGRGEGANSRPDPGLVGESARDGQDCIADDRLAVCGMETGRRGAAIGAHQPARTEKHTTEPAADHHRHPIQVLAVYGLKNWTSRSAPGFTIVAGPEEVSDPESPAIVTRVPSAARGNKSTRLFLSADRARRGKKSAFFDLLLELLIFPESEHCLPPPSFLRRPEADIPMRRCNLFAQWGNCDNVAATSATTRVTGKPCPSIHGHHRRAVMRRSDDPASARSITRSKAFPLPAT
ncbi:protein of unknown function (plasmid) [Azospirillum baldaniorum]|uniref:Uncharacterized protein n=1 Tax=Azospirillum baldaniorum TaxID=1064539 RepID=A0A9P1NRD8_9PROT|nr:protein of unknown function [Azospirillum baldaniorum]